METESKLNFTFLGRNSSNLSINDNSSSTFSDCNSDRSGEYPTISSQSRRLILAAASENPNEILHQLVSDLESTSLDLLKKSAMKIRLLRKNKPENWVKIARAAVDLLIWSDDY